MTIGLLPACFPWKVAQWHRCLAGQLRAIPRPVQLIAIRALSHYNGPNDYITNALTSLLCYVTTKTIINNDTVCYANEFAMRTLLELSKKSFPMRHKRETPYGQKPLSARPLSAKFSFGQPLSANPFRPDPIRPRTL